MAFDLRKQTRFRRPEFQEKLVRARNYQREPASGNFRFTWGRAIIIVLFLAIVYFLSLSGVFLVNDVRISGTDLPQEQIEDVFSKLSSRRWYVIPRNHILLLTKNNLLKVLQAELPQIRQITSIKRSLPNRLEIGIEIRKPMFVWQSDNDFFLLDQDGVIFQKITDYDPAVFSEALITDRTAGEIHIGEQLEIEKTLSFVEETNKLWPQYVSQANPVNFAVPGIKSPDIFVKMSLGFMVYFDLERRVDQQLKKLALVLNQKIPTETYPGLSYIDLRLSTLGYYCYKDALCAPENATSTPNL